MWTGSLYLDTELSLYNFFGYIYAIQLYLDKKLSLTTELSSGEGFGPDVTQKKWYHHTVIREQTYVWIYRSPTQCDDRLCVIQRQGAWPINDEDRNRTSFARDMVNQETITIFVKFHFAVCKHELWWSVKALSDPYQNTLIAISIKWGLVDFKTWKMHVGSQCKATKMCA